MNYFQYMANYIGGSGMKEVKLSNIQSFDGSDFILTDEQSATFDKLIAEKKPIIITVEAKDGEIEWTVSGFAQAISVPGIEMFVSTGIATICVQKDDGKWYAFVEIGG